LSERELEVLRLVATGVSNQDIAGQLFIALSTVKKHVGNILVKLDTPNRVQAITRARDLGLLS
jgi:ATP/maltotriose-dependent transcriptional regulator MalT